MRGVVISGTHSGCGKTTAALGIMAALRKKGLIVQPFKTGPDFIDAGLHRLAVGRPSRNLDLWMCGKDYVADCFTRCASGADIAVIEGVMGLYDGALSTASLACLLGMPVLLVIDGYGMAESAGAVAAGFTEFGAGSSELTVTFAGVIFNRVASESHFKRLKESIRAVPVLGYLPRELDFEIPRRHLGLATAEEEPITRENIEKLADAVLQHIDVDMLLRQAGRTGDRDEKGSEAARRASDSAFRVAVAYDKAFCFYYEDNLDQLKDAGAEIVRFSPIADSRIPDDIDAVYFGGGYPELHAEALSRNTSLIKAMRALSDAGKPIYAECGGLMYLSQGVLGFDNSLFPMAGVFPFKTRMTKTPTLAYRELTLNQDCILGSKGRTCRGHEFHYSEIDDRPKTDDGSPINIFEGRPGMTRIYSVRDRNGAEARAEGYRYKNTLASYIHVHFGSNRSIASTFAEFVRSCKPSFPGV